MMNKKGIAFETLGVIIIVLLVFVTGGYLYAKIGTFASLEVVDRICQTSAIANAYGRTPITEAEVFSLDCPRKLTTLKFLGVGKGVELETKVKIGDQEKIFTDTVSSYKTAKKEIVDYKFEETDNDMFVINNAIADQVKKCWDNMGNGNLNLFSKWWLPIGLGNPNTPPSQQSWIEKKLPGIRNAPTNCVICSRIVFDEKAQELIKNKYVDGKINSLVEWMNKNPISGSQPPISYTEYMLDDLHTGLFTGENFKYDASEPQAIMFARINVLKGAEWWKGTVKVFKWTALNTASIVYGEGISWSELSEPPADVDVIYIVPYSEIGKQCTVLYN